MRAHFAAESTLIKSKQSLPTGILKRIIFKNFLANFRSSNLLMGLETYIKKQLRYRYPTAFDYKGPNEIPVLCVDFMQFVKGTIPDYITTEQQLVDYFFRKIIGLTDSSDQVVICFDKSSPEVKKIVCYKTRKEIRCAKCKKLTPLPDGKTVFGSEFFDPNCDKRCSEKQVFHYEEGPHLPEGGGPLKFKPEEWMRFASDSRNLRCELYPRIANKLLGHILKFGKTIYLNGMPFKNKRVYEWQFNSSVVGDKGIREERIVLDNWSYDDLPLKQEEQYDLFCQTIVIREHMKYIEPQMFNTIQEADNSIFWFLKFFPQCYRQMVYINDGDAISIGLFLALEYYIAPESASHELWLCLPKKKDKQFTENMPHFEYINLKTLCEKVQDTLEFKAAGVQSPVATLVFLIILSGTDFFQDYCSNIVTIRQWSEDPDKREKQTHGVWDTFYENLSLYSHLVQFYKGESNVSVQKRIVIDRDLFRIFTKACYHNAYHKKARKKLKLKDDQDVDHNHIRVYCSKSMTNLQSHPPTEDIMDRQCAQIDWNINYWLNEQRGVHIDPFEKDPNGVPYYGYENGKLVHVVAKKQKPVDEVCKRHFWKRKQKQEDEYKGVPEKRKRDALEVLKGN